jgi:hypothetical protein
MDDYVGTFPTKAEAIRCVESVHLGRGKRRRIRAGYYQIDPRTDADRQPTYYLVTKDHLDEWAHLLPSSQ